MAQEYPTLRLVPTREYIKKLRVLIKTAKTNEIDLNYKESTLRCILCKSRYPSLDLISKLAKLETSLWNFTFREIGYIRGERSDKPMKLVKKLTPELCYILGAFRDGGMSSHKYQIHISQKDRRWITDTINPLLEKTFALKLHYRGFRKGTHEFSLNSKPLYAFLDVVGQFKNKFKPTPQIILNAPFKFQKYYIAGFYDAEGDKSLKSGRVGLYQAWSDKSACPPLEDIRKILQKQEIISTLHKSLPRKNSFAFRLYVNKRPRVNILKFLKLIPVSHPNSLLFKKSLCGSLIGAGSP